ncbi:MAG TPA: hypothetical protein ENF21_03025 [Bacteroidetes bacterium]|nr:hypothetical protein [Bacteroidota bacterium]
MKRISPGMAVFVLMVIVVCTGCKKDEDPVIQSVNTGVIDDEEYTGGGALSLLFSTTTDQPGVPTPEMLKKAPWCW